jgi:hypothetical protein
VNLLALFQSYKPALARVTVQTATGDLSTGTAFHIGDGWLVTAAHVLKEGAVQEIVAEQHATPLSVQSVIFNSDDRIDLALMKTDLDLSHYLHMTTIHGAPEGFIQTDHIEIGGHLDDWLGDELVLSKVLLMGYPPIPFSQHAVLLASEGEVNAVIDKYIGPHPHFIISCPARGGFSGGPVLSEYGFLLGVLTESLVTNDKAAETGYSSAISVEPLLAMLHDNGIYPGKNRETIEALFDGVEHDFAQSRRLGNITRFVHALKRKVRTIVWQTRRM